MEHLQPEIMAFEAETAESVNDVQVSHLQRHQQMVEAHMGRMLQGMKLLQLIYCNHMPDLQHLFIMKISCIQSVNWCKVSSILTHESEN